MATPSCSFKWKAFKLKVHVSKSEYTLVQCVIVLVYSVSPLREAVSQTRVTL